MAQRYSDTIFALATSRQKSALALFRISGKESIILVNKILSRKNKEIKKPLVTYLIDENDNKIDQVVVTAYKSPLSYTGENMVEISCHGSVAIINKITEVFFKNKIRLAEPGEFTKRALLNNKLSLVQAETINELINAETEKQRKISIGNLSGKLDVFIENVSKNLLKLLADVEAIIDFADEDLPEQLTKSIVEQKENLIILLDQTIKNSLLSKKIYEGYRVSVIGKPNTGKSSFINFINNKEISIVTSIPGTTTDLISSVLEIEGDKYTFIDTAGIRKHKNLIEKIGIEKSIESAKNSDLTLVFLKNNEKNNYKNIKNKIFIKSKFDKNKSKLDDVVNISSHSGYGIKRLLKKISLKISKTTTITPMFSRERHIKQLEDTRNWLKKANFMEIDLAADDIRRSIKALRNINQQFDIEEILDIIFNDFCIGK